MDLQAGPIQQLHRLDSKVRGTSGLFRRSISKIDFMET